MRTQVLQSRVSNCLPIVALHYEGGELDDVNRRHFVRSQQGDDVREDLIGLFTDGAWRSSVFANTDLAGDEDQRCVRGHQDCVAV